MAITPVSNQESLTASPTSPVTVAVDIGTRTNGLLVVGLGYFASNTHSISITYGGVALTKIAEQPNNTAAYSAALYYLAGPTDGANDLVITYTVDSGGALSNLYALASWYDGAAQTSVLDQQNAGTGSTDPSLAITPTEDNELIVSQYFSADNDVLTVGAGETGINNYDIGNNVYGGSYAIQTTAGAQTIDFAGVDNTWQMVVASFKAAGGAPPATVPMRTLLGVGV